MAKELVKKVKKSKGGFTLIEMVVVIGILAILAVVLIPAVGGQISNAKKAAANSDAQSVYMAAQLYATDYENTNGACLASGDITGDSLTAIESQPEFASLFTVTQGTGGTTSVTGKNELKISKISVGANGQIISITMTDKNATTAITYPQ